LVIESAELVVLAGDDGLRPVWRVDPYPDPRTLAHPWIHVDAVTGAVEVGPDRSVHARARVFARNPVLDTEATEVELAFVDPEAGALAGPYFHGTNCVRPDAGLICALADVPPDADGNWLPPAPDITVAADNEDPDDAFAAVSVFAHADRFQQFAIEHGLGDLPCPVSTLVANYRVFTDDGWISFGNAVYTGDCSLTAAFGQGSDADWGYDGDVVHHELTHGLVARLMGEGRFLGLRRDRDEAVLGDALAVNEGIADFVAAVMSGDPRHAEYITDVGGSGGRDADNDYVCPDDLVGEPHYDSEIVSGALWSAYEEIGVELVRAILLSVALLEEDTTFEEASAVFVDVVRDELGPAAAAVLAAELAARGLDDCPRVAAWHRVQRPLWIHPVTAPGQSFEPMRPPAVQLAFTMPPDRRRLVVRYAIDVLAPPMWAPDPALNVLVRHGAPLEFLYVPDGGKTQVVAEPDEHLSGVEEGFEVEAEPGTTVYVAFFNLHVTTVILSELEVSFEGEVAGTDSGSETGVVPDTSGGGATEATEASAAPSDSGCGCAGGRASPGGLLLLVFLFMGHFAKAPRLRQRSCLRLTPNGAETAPGGSVRKPDKA
jgi:hypothetical protein